MSKANLRRRGTVGEAIAAVFLQQRGVELLEHSFRSGRSGEIDLIGRDGTALVFFEVKLRSDVGSGAPQEAVTQTKQKTICRTADYYRFLHGIAWETPVRFDVVAIEMEAECAHVRWIKGAFPYHR